MSEAGYDVLGIDISEAMIAMVRRRCRGGDFEWSRCSRRNFLAPWRSRRSANASITCSIAGNTRSSLAKLLRRIYESLVPGGLFLFDVAEPGRVPGTGIGRTYFEGDDWAVLVTNEEDRRRRLLTRRITSFRRVGELYRRDQEVHRQRLLAAVRAGGPAPAYWLSGAYPSRLWHVAVWAGPRRLSAASLSIVDRSEASLERGSAPTRNGRLPGLRERAHLGYKVPPSHVTEPRRMGFSAPWPGMAVAANVER